MKKINRLAMDGSGVVTMGLVLLIIAIAAIITVIVLLYYFPFMTLGVLICGGAIYFLFDGRIEPKPAGILFIVGIIFASIGVLMRLGVF